MGDLYLKNVVKSESACLREWKGNVKGEKGASVYLTGTQKRVWGRPESVLQSDGKADNLRETGRGSKFGRGPDYLKKGGGARGRAPKVV